MSQFVDDLSLNQSGVHIEAHQTTGTTIDIVLLKGDVYVQIVSCFEELRAHSALISITTNRKFNTGAGRLALLVQRYTTGQTTDLIDIQIVFGCNRRNS